MSDMNGDGVPDEQVLGAALHAELMRSGATISTAESLTGGALADLLSASPGAGETFLGGVVCYAAEAKQKVLGVAEQTVAAHGVVSRQCALEMAHGVRSLLGTDWGVSTTGVAGPTEQEGKPAGLVYVAMAGPQGARCEELHLHGDRAEIRHQTCLRAAVLTLESVTGVAV